MTPLRTYVYIDGFNLFYGLLKGSSHKWLDLDKLCRLYLDETKNEIIKIKYFTALVIPRVEDPFQNSRQQAYLKALQTLQNFEIIYGHFLSHEVMMRRADGGGYVKVIKTEEKKTDVNIATHMLNDAYQNRYDMAVLVSNDSDLSEPLKIITTGLNKKVGILCPHKRRSVELSKYTTFFKSIRKGSLPKCQFPEQITSSFGNIFKPDLW